MRIPLSIPVGLKLKEDFSLWQNQETKKEYLRHEQGDNLTLLENFCRYVQDEHSYPPPWVLRGMAEIISDSLAKPATSLNKAFGLSGKRGPDEQNKVEKLEVVRSAYYLRYWFGLKVSGNKQHDDETLWDYLLFLLPDKNYGETYLQDIYKQNTRRFTYGRFQELAAKDCYPFEESILEYFPKNKRQYLKSLYLEIHGGV